jgi:hypothetical protein
MNRYKKELLKRYTPEQIKQLDADSKQQQFDDARKFPELYYYMFDSSFDINLRARGISPMTKEFRDEMRERFKRGDYPERLHCLVKAELDLKHPEED